MRWLTQRPAWLMLSLLALQSIAKKDKPAIEVTSFKNDIANLMYFEDSDVLLFTDRETSKIWHSDDAGFQWSKVKDVKDVVALIKHPYDSNVAVVLGAETTHWITTDQAKTWRKFSTPAPVKFAGRTLAFHASDPNRILIQGADCIDIFACVFPVYYTLDGFKTEAKELLDDAISCLWAKTAKEFSTGDEDLDKSRVICNVEGAFSFFSSESRVLISDDFFETKGVEPLLDGDRPINGIISVASVTRYLAAAASSDRSNELALYVTSDCIHWQRAEFGKHRIEEDAYTILESTNYSMQVDVQTGRSGSLGALYTSNTEGNFFTMNLEHTNRNPMGYVDFEKIQDIPGIVLVNRVKNWEDVEVDPRAAKEIVTQISFDDGRNWLSLLVDKKELHLHSVTDQINVGRVFSSPAPGIIMGVGNTGKSLGDRSEGNTYISDDAGLTWNLAQKGPHLYETGDQGALIVMISDDATDEIKYSLNHGKDWSKAELPHKVRPTALTTTPDSTSLKFILTAQNTKKDEDGGYLVIAFDFAELHEKKCGKDDFEDWYARVDEDGEPTCLMGHTHMFRRRKADADCFVDEEFKDPEPVLKDCECTDADYECDFGFVAGEDWQCKPDGKLQAPPGACESKDTFMGSSGYRLIPGNTCQGGVTKDEPIERKCHDTTTLPPSGDINSTTTVFSKEEYFKDFYYLERCENCNGDDETVLALSDRGVVYITRNQGKDWTELFGTKDKITAIYPHQYFDDQVFFITNSKQVFYSKNRGATIHSFETPEPPNTDSIPALSFHPKETEWLIWVGEKKDERSGGKGRQTIAQVSKKHGDDWETLLRSVGKCDFIYREGRPNSTNLVYCEQHDDEDPDAPLNLVGSNDWFESHTKLKEDVVDFTTMAEFIVVARNVREDESLRVDASIDGMVFADAKFPRNFKVEHQRAYTVLESNTHSIFLHVTVNGERDSQYGSIIKSNSNGTAYTLSINEVNRNGPGYVDFEKVRSLEGVILVNVVANVDDLSNGDAKKFRTMITHNDGAEWAPIARPKDSGDFDRDWCSGSVDECSLHLLGFTESVDPRITYSSPTAIGLLIGNGNVGSHLADKDKLDTFMSTDGGIEWTMIAEGKWLWEYGDRGSIIVIVKQGVPVTDIRYTLDEGKTWQTYSFTDDEMNVTDISSVPSDTSRNFLLWGSIKGKLATVNIDFSGLQERSKRCSLDESNPESDDDDYLLWSPKHPLSATDCLFGHKAKYHRKLLDRDCYNGQRLPVLHDITENCPCTRQDFECDYNFERQPGGDCKLVPGLDPPNPLEACFINGTEEYSEITGYRRIPITTCDGGRELDFSPVRTKPCPGYQDRHGMSGVGLFFAIVLPIVVASAAGWWVWTNWDGKFGRIQLGDGPAGSRIGLGGAFERDAPWIKYPVLGISAVVAVIAAVPMVVSTVWRTLQTRLGRSSGRYGGYNRPYTSRSSFQRSRGNYSVVDPDEGELLGDESEDEET